MHGSAQGSCAFAVDNAYLKYMEPPALGNIVGDKRRDLARLKGVQVKRAVDWNLNRFYFIY